MCWLMLFASTDNFWEYDWDLSELEGLPQPLPFSSPSVPLNPSGRVSRRNPTKVGGIPYIAYILCHTLYTMCHVLYAIYSRRTYFPGIAGKQGQAPRKEKDEAHRRGRAPGKKKV